ncbi:hypothetical protein DsansV1_C24g0180781 [Dioscorea sansibarensis]
MLLFYCSHAATHLIEYVKGVMGEAIKRLYIGIQSGLVDSKWTYLTPGQAKNQKLMYNYILVRYYAIMGYFLGNCYSLVHLTYTFYFINLYLKMGFFLGNFIALIKIHLAGQKPMEWAFFHFSC